MKKSFIAFAGIFLTAMLFTGCASKGKAYQIPLPEVTIAKGAQIKVTSVGNGTALNQLTNAAKSFFSQRGCKPVDRSPDYWVVLYGTHERRIDSVADQKHNIRFKKVQRSNANGGEELVVSEKFMLTSDAHFISMVIYRVKDLKPILNFDFPSYFNGGKYDIKRSVKLSRSEMLNTMGKMLIFK